MPSFNKYLQKPEASTVLLIDGDLYAYRACAAAEEEIDWGDDVWSLATDLRQAKDIFEDFIQTTCDRLKSDTYVVCMSDKDNFRKLVDPAYKGGRKKLRKPVGYAEFLNWIEDTYWWFRHPLLEADDILGIVATAPGHKTIMVSDDKDLRSVPGKLYRPMSEELITISQAEADLWFYTQTLTGDVTDGYAGCPTVGAKTAEKILGPAPTWNTVVNAYQKQKLGADHAVQQARLARILRYEDWNAEEGSVKLWEPGNA
jgi:DNA polymerase-1